jgi:3-oxoacyl-[acyl-carrier protein] reductase
MMDLNLNGKAAAITGGAGGIGMSMARAFAKEGCRLAICDIDEQSLNRAADEFGKQGLDIYAEKVDVCNPDDIQSFVDNVVKTYGCLDIWMNNAGTIIDKPIIDSTPEEWDKVIRVNLYSAFLGTRAAARQMMKSGGGCIINTSSITAVVPTANKASYGASKAAIVSLTKTSAGELAPYKIRCNAILPGFIETKMMAARLATGEREKLLALVPDRTIGKPEDIANLAVFLASEKAHHITGAAYEVSGGMFSVQDPMTPWGK